jgi:hypothetical protein
LKLTTVPATKPVPVNIRVNAGPPAVVLVGEIAVSVGAGLGAVVIMKTKFAVVPPPGAELVTVMLAFPDVAISVAKMAAVICVELTNVVAFALPLNFTTELETKPVPLTVSGKAAPPATMPVGLSEVIVGAGLLTVKLAAVEVPPPGAGFVTVTGTIPAVAMSPAGMDAVSCVALTNVVVAATPLKLTAAPLTKPEPVTVRVKPVLPAVALLGESVVMTGGGLVTEKLMAGVEVPPPGAALVTVTGKLPAAAISVVVMDAIN